MISSAKFWIGIGLSAALIALFLLTVDVRHMLAALAQANYVYVIPAIALYLIAVVFRTMRWQALLGHMKHVGVRRLFPVVVVGYMANNILPMRLGELVRSYYLGEREGISKTASLTTIFVERMLDALTLLFFIAAIALFVPLYGLAEGLGEWSGVAWPLLAAAFSVPFVAAFGVLVAFAVFPDRARAIALTLIRPLPQRFEAIARHLIDYFLHGLTSLRSPKTLALLFVLSIPVWLFEAGLFYMVGLSFDLDSAYGSPMQMAIAMVLVSAVANLGAAVPGSPGGIGLFELITRETLILLPLAMVDRSAAAGFATVTHALLLLVMIIPGLAYLWTENVSLRRLVRTSRSATADGSGALSGPRVGEG